MQEITRHGGNLHLPGFDLGEIEHIVEQGHQRLAGVENDADLFLLRRGEAIGLERLRHAENAIERRADLVAHVGEELRLGVGGGLGHILGGAHLGLDRLPGGEIDNRADQLAGVDGVGGDRLGAQLHPAPVAIGHADAQFLLPAVDRAFARGVDGGEDKIAVFRMDELVEQLQRALPAFSADDPGERLVDARFHGVEIDFEIAIARAADRELQARLGRVGLRQCPAQRHHVGVRELRGRRDAQQHANRRDGDGDGDPERKLRPRRMEHEAHHRHAAHGQRAQGLAEARAGREDDMDRPRCRDHDGDDPGALSARRPEGARGDHPDCDQRKLGEFVRLGGGRVALPEAVSQHDAGQQQHDGRNGPGERPHQPERMADEDGVGDRQHDAGDGRAVGQVRQLEGRHRRCVRRRLSARDPFHHVTPIHKIELTMAGID